MNESAPHAFSSHVIPARRRFADIVARFVRYGIWLHPDDQTGVYVSPWKSVGEGHRARFAVTYPSERTYLTVAYMVMPCDSVRGPGLLLTTVLNDTANEVWQYSVREPCDEDLAARFAGPWPPVDRQDRTFIDLAIDRLLTKLIETYALAGLP